MVSASTSPTSAAGTPVAAAGVGEAADLSPSSAPTTSSEPTTSSISLSSVVVTSAPAESVSSVQAAMGMIVTGAPTSSTTTSTSSSGAGLSRKNDGVIINSVRAEQESSSTDAFIRTLSGSKLNAEAPEFVPKGIAAGPAPVSIPRLVSGTSLPIPGVLPVHFVDPFSSTSSIESIPSTAVKPPPVVASSFPTPNVSDGDDSFFPHESSPPRVHAPVPHAPHPKPVIITEELKAKIVKQVEFYFSDQNLPTDNFLMKFVKKDPEGFVPIPVVAAFRKVKILSKNHGVVAAALRNSSLLVVSDDGKKVRRAEPLPDVDLEEVQTRTVVAENLPADHSVENMEHLFGTVGTVRMVRICQPEAANGANQTAAKFKSDMVVSNKLHALVEFETVEQAEKAVVALTDQGNWRSGLRVRLLLRRTFHSKHGFQAPYQKGRKPGGEESNDHDETGAEDKTGEDLGPNYDRSEEASGNDGASGIERDGGGKRGKGRGRGRGPAGRGKGQHGGAHHIGSNGSRNHQPGTSPQTSHNHIANHEVVNRLPPGPRMPDGTRGFTLGRGKLPGTGPA